MDMDISPEAQELLLAIYRNPQQIVSRQYNSLDDILRLGWDH